MSIRDRVAIDNRACFSKSARGQFMITSLNIENFRCFERLDADDFGQFNIVVGNNAGGKTAFLESIYLPGGGPDVFWKYFAWRAIPMPGQGTWTIPRWEFLWRDAFFQFDINRTIKITLEGSTENKRALRISFDHQRQKTPFPPPSTIPGLNEPPVVNNAFSSVSPVVFETTDDTGNEFSMILSVNAKGEYDSNGSVAPGVLAFNPSSQPYNASETAELFSALSRKNEGSKLKSTLQTVYPDILDVSLEQSANGNTLYCARPGVKERVPLGLVSTGISKLVQILLNIASTPGGIVIVDEIENGFYYKVLPEMWKAIIHFCKEYNVQLFASTHSRECLTALDDNMQDHLSDFRLLRAEEDTNRRHSLKTFKGKDFDAALKTGVDPR